jgi:hypothetical protein
MLPSRFDIIAHADPQTLIRLLNYFAVVGLFPTLVNAVEAGGMVSVRIELADLDEKQARIIAEKMRSSVLAETVSVRCGGHLLLPHHGVIDDLSA